MTIAERLERTDFTSSKSEEKSPVTSDVSQAERVPPPAPAWGRTSRDDVRAQIWVQITLLLVVAALLFYLMSIPRPRASRAMLSQEHELVELRLALEELREVIADYHAAHGTFPGRGSDGAADPSGFERQIVLAMNSTGDDTAERIPAQPFGPYEPRGVPVNPVNGLSTVRFLAANEPWPSEADGRTGWLYRPATGEIRADCRSTAFGSAPCYYDL